MSFAKEMWDTLVAVDCSEHTEKKGKFTYLSWAWAWQEFTSRYPESVYSLKHQSFDDGTMEVQCSMHVEKGGETVARNMWLPVLDFKNTPIKNPNAFHINTAKMRCLVKCLAMYGLGHYIYAGEDLPEAQAPEEMFETSINAIKAGIASGDLSSASEEWFCLDKDVMTALWKSPRSGGCFTTKERDVIKSAEFRIAHYGES